MTQVNKVMVVHQRKEEKNDAQFMYLFYEVLCYQSYIEDYEACLLSCVDNVNQYDGHGLNVQTFNLNFFFLFW